MLTAQVAVRLGAFDLNVAIGAAPGEIVAVLGPNGAGKSTFLRAVAGLVRLDRGRVELDEVCLEDVARGIHLPPERRPIGVVFQDYLLFPHLSALENVAFGLRARGVATREARVRAGSWLDRLGLGGHADAKPRALSGGQAQRVALARALAIDPRLLLLDEPLAALDASARGEVRRDLKRHLASFAGIRIVITHDPLEAVALADRLVILERGRVVQTGSPADVTQRPRSRYVADLVGVNLLRGISTAGQVALPGGASLQSADGVDGEVFAVIHPRAVALHRGHPEGSPRNVWRGRASALDFQLDRVRVRVEGEVPIIAEVTAGAVSDLDLTEGGEVWVSVKATEITVYPA
jgi:molybdate transport system ATP-binding protein